MRKVQPSLRRFGNKTQSLGSTAASELTREKTNVFLMKLTGKLWGSQSWKNIQLQRQKSFVLINKNILVSCQ